MDKSIEIHPLPTPKVRLLDELAGPAGLMGLGLGLAGRFTKLDFFRTGGIPFRIGTGLTLFSLIWTSTHSLGRLLESLRSRGTSFIPKGKIEGSQDPIADLLLCLGSIQACSAIVTQPFLKHPSATIGATRLALLIDAGNLGYLLFRYLFKDDQMEQVTIGQVALQAGLTLLFGLPSRKIRLSPPETAVFPPRRQSPLPVESSRFPRGRWTEFDRGQFQIERRLGSGGLSNVLLARHHSTGERVVLKILRYGRHPVSANQERMAAVTLREQTDSPHLIRHLGQFRASGGNTGLVLEYLEGETLAGRLDTGRPLDPVEAVELFIDYLRGVQASHRAGLLHRDLTPKNLFILQTGRGKVIDFGLARPMNRHGLYQTNGGIEGTHPYMPVETVRGEVESKGSDLYSLGSCLYEALAGRPVRHFRRGEHWMNSILWQTDLPPYLFDVRPVPLSKLEAWEELDSAVVKALQKEPGDRYQTADEFLQALLDWKRRWVIDPTKAVPIRKWKFTDSLRALVRPSHLGTVRDWQPIPPGRERHELR